MSRRVYIGLSKPRAWNPLSAIIKLVLRTKYSHSYIRIDTPQDFDVIYEASGSSVRFVAGDIWRKKNRSCREWEMEISLRTYDEVLIPYLMRLCGRKYGTFQLIGLFFSLLFRLKYNPVSRSSQRMICSELIYYVLTSVFKKNWDKDPDIVTPKDIERYLDVPTQE